MIKLNIYHNLKVPKRCMCSYQLECSILATLDVIFKQDFVGLCSLTSKFIIPLL